MKTVKIDLPPSATPHQDANLLAREMLIKQFAGKTDQPGFPGIRYRIGLAMMLAYGEAAAKEFDFGSKASDVITAFADAFGNVGASLLVSIVMRKSLSEEEKYALIEQSLERMFRHALKRGSSTIKGVFSGELPDEETLSVSYYDHPPAGKA